MGGDLPIWLDDPDVADPQWSRSRRLGGQPPFQFDLSGAKKFRVGTSNFDRNWGSSTPVVDAVGFLALLSASSVDFPLSFSLLMVFLYGRKCSNCGVDCFPFGGALFEDCRQVMKHLRVHSIQGAIQLLQLFMSPYYSKHVVTIFWHILYYIASEILKGRQREREEQKDEEMNFQFQQNSIFS
jgi:hypothetical protein